MSKLKLTPWQLSLAAAVFIIAVSNTALFAALVENPDMVSIQGLGFFLAVVLLMVFVLNTIFLILGHGWLLKPIIAFFLLATSIISYFSNQLGVVVDAEMLLNVGEAMLEHNSAEAQELLSLPLLAHLLVFGIVPSFLLGAVHVVPRRPLAEIGVRTVVTIFGLALLVGTVIPNYKFVSFFARENDHLAYKAIPVFSTLSAVNLARAALHRAPAFRVIDADAKQLAGSSKRSVGIMVVGETARADHFSLGGYLRNTNPQLTKADSVFYAAATSCGTSTLFSVPCMFSMRGREDYAPHFSKEESNVLDILSAAGVRTVWIDNNSSCKGVCARIEKVNLRRTLDESSPYFSDAGYYDEILLQSIDAYLEDETADVLIVLHTLGSHGPAYSRRYPPAFDVFTPACDQASPTQCSDNDVKNAYDNTLVYTDFVLNKLIAKLSARSDEFDAFVFYASDHGESLGENGVYLHGLPYAIAPAAQTEVPFVFWMSSGFSEQHDISQQVAHEFEHRQLSHDNISHSLLGLYNIEAASYQPQLDIFPNARLALAAADQ